MISKQPMKSFCWSQLKVVNKKWQLVSLIIPSCYDWFQDKNSVTRCQNVVKTIKSSINKKKKRRKGLMTASSSVHPPPTAVNSPTVTVSSTSVPSTEKIKSHIDDLRKFLRQFLKKSFSMTDLQMKPYRTDEYVHKLFYETTRFSAFNHQWIVKAIINNSQRDVHQCNDRQITYQVKCRWISFQKLYLIHRAFSFRSHWNQRRSTRWPSTFSCCLGRSQTWKSTQRSTNTTSPTTRTKVLSTFYLCRMSLKPIDCWPQKPSTSGENFSIMKLLHNLKAQQLCLLQINHVLSININATKFNFWDVKTKKIIAENSTRTWSYFMFFFCPFLISRKWIILATFNINWNFESSKVS